MSTDINTNACLSFRIGSETFATSVNHAHEILELTKITKIPHAPVFMKGVTNLRGTVLPVIDTRIKFGFPATAATDDSCIIVLNIEANNRNIVIGALVDSVTEVFDVLPGDIKPLPTIGARYNAGFIKGTIKSGDDFILFLDIDKVFSTEEMIQIQHAECSVD